MLRWLVLLLGLSVLPQVFGESEMRQFTSVDGVTIEARLASVSEDGRQISIVRSDGMQFTLPIDRLSEEDREFIANYAESVEEASEVDASSEYDSEVERINELIGHKLFVDQNLWDDAVSKIAERLDWPEESMTDEQSSYRIYAGEDFTFCGPRAYTAALYGREKKANRISVVFANKGDFFDKKNAGNGGIFIPDTAKLQEAIENDLELLEARLSAILGEASRQSYGKGSSYRRVTRWDWGAHAFILSHEDAEYVTLSIEPGSIADAKGKVEYIRSSVLRQHLEEQVTKNDFGDVLIKNIPMVDQGPKGYCVPATFERYMRYMGMRADMYLLAMMGNTQAGGGSYMGEFVEALKRDILRQGRDLEKLDVSMSIRSISRYIDKGLPLIWTLYSTNQFTQEANKLTKKRGKVEQRDEWIRFLSELREGYRPELYGYSNGHAAMVIGYNKETDEVAISDSWGPEFELRWIPIELAEAVFRDFYVIRY